MNLDEAISLSLRFDETQRLASDDEPSSYLFKATGKLLLVNDDDEETEIGRFSLSTLDAVSACVEKQSLSAFCDSDYVAMGYFETLYDYGTGDFKESVVATAYGDLGNYLWNPNILMLDNLIVYQQHRGKLFGLLALRALMHRFGLGVGLIAMKPYPLQFEAGHAHQMETDVLERSRFGRFDATEGKARARLRKYYGRLGFKLVRGTQYMVRSLESPLPLLTEL